jgi:hypothetical protein
MKKQKTRLTREGVYATIAYSLEKALAYGVSQRTDESDAEG